MGRPREEKFYRSPPIVAGRVPPHDLDAEAAVLSAIMLSADALDSVLTLLRPEHFYSDANGRIFEAAAALAAVGTPVDVITVCSWLRDRDDALVKIGGSAYVAQIADATPAVADVLAHAKIVFDKWRVRNMIAACQHIAAEGYGDIGTADAWLDESEARISKLTSTSGSVKLEHVGEITKRWLAEVTAADQGTIALGLPVGYSDLENCGIRPKNLHIVAGRPGMAKTSLALQMALNVVEASPVPPPGVALDQIPDNLRRSAAAIFSLEMPREGVMNRLYCATARVDIGAALKRQLSSSDWNHLLQAAEWIGKLPIWVDDTPGITLTQLRSMVRMAAAKARRVGAVLRIVVVDYLQLMRGTFRGGDSNREQEIAEISRGLKEIAKTHDVAVVACSQLNRAVENRNPPRPQLSDLRESGAIEQDADVVLLLYRPDYYKDRITVADEDRGVAEIAVAKQRDGAAGWAARLKYWETCARFDNLARSEY